MNRWQLFLSTARAALASVFGGSWLAGMAKAETSAATAAAPQIQGDERLASLPPGPETLEL